MKNKIHKPPRLAKWLLNKMIRYQVLYSMTSDVEEVYYSVLENKGSFSADIWYWHQSIVSFYTYFNLSFLWRFAMFKNYLKIAYRNFIRYKLFSFINVFGLAIGIAACMVINIWVQRELSYDRFHKNADRIFRIERELFRDNSYSKWPITGGAYKQALIDEYPEIENAVRLWDLGYAIKDHRNIVHSQFLFVVDNSIFDIFDFDLKKGDSQTALIEPNTVVLTRESALKYLGTEDALGKSLTFEMGAELVDFEVTGILKDIPKNSHVHFEVLISISSFPENLFSDWRSNYLYTYVLIKKNTSKNDLEDKLKTFVNTHLAPNYGDLLSPGVDIHDVFKMELFPITDIHLYPKVNHEIEPQGNISSVYIFSSIALLILIIACINFMNLSTARANKRAKEVGLRKTLGAFKSQLRAQFIAESVFLAGIALLLSVVFTSLFILIYNYVFNDSMSVYLLLQAKNLIILFGITAAAGLISGLYPAFYMTRFEPVRVLKGGVHSGKGKSSFRRNMVVLQFVISITMIIGMLTNYKQMRYIQTRDLGFDKENVVVISARGRSVAQGLDAFRNELMRSPKVESVSASFDIPGDRIFSNTGIGNPLDESNQGHSMYYIFGDHDFWDTYRLDVLTGRGFSRDFSTDSAAVMINEAAAQKLGWTTDQAVGKQINAFIRRTCKVIGVVRNFNYRSLRQEIEPLVIFLSTVNARNISVRILPGDVVGTLGFIQQKWEKIFPGEQYNYRFLDDRINQLYENEKKMQSISFIFSYFSIFVGCLGLFGLVAFIAEQRTKEIGIRKVLGSTVSNIVLLLSKEFLFLVTISNLIAWPIAWYFFNNWLQSFAYRTSIGVITFILSAFLSFIIAVITVGYQAFKAARANPIDSLKHE